MMTRKQVGELIRTRRMSRGWTQEQLAEKLGCSTSAIGMYESGKRLPKNEVIEALADIFNVPIWSITMTEDEVNGSTDEDDIWTLRESLRRDPNRRLLFDLAKNASTKDVEAAVALIDALRRTNPDFYDGDDPA